MSCIKHWLEEVYYAHEDGASIEELASKWNISSDQIIRAIEIMRETMEES